MSYATSLRMAYPPPYGPSTLLSDDLVRQSSFTSYYHSALPYSGTNYLLTNAYRYDYPTHYRTPSYTNWQRTTMPVQISSTSTNNIQEYSESLGTTSNTNTASSLARSIDETNTSNYRRNSQLQTISSPKINEEIKPTAITYRSLPELTASKLKPKTPIPIVELNQQEPSVDVQAWINETPKDDQQAEQAWTEKIDQLHLTRNKREKEKAKSSRTPLPKSINETNITPNRTNSYFDSLFEGNFVRKTSTNQQHLNSSYQQKFVTRNESPIKPKTTILQRKFPTYEPPSIKKSQPVQTTIKRSVPKQPNTDSQTPRENIHLDDAERFRQALQKFRLDRAEQQLRENNESTAKRLNYGNYVRRSIRDGSLHNSIKPLPWTDFFELKKGNVYSLNKEEKKDLYNQSRSYGERIRYRNINLHNYPQETPRIIPFPTVNEETESTDDENSTPKSDKHSSSTIRPDISDSHHTSRTNSSTN